MSLKGKKVIITRPKEQSAELSRLLEAEGAQVVEFPTIKIVPPSSWKEVDRAIENLSEYNWLIFTSVNGVKFFFQRLYQKNVSLSPSLKLAAIGSATAGALREQGQVVDFIPEEYVAESVVNGFVRGFDIAGKRALLPRAEQARDVLPNGLRKAGMEVDVVTVYRSVLAEEAPATALKLLRRGEIDLITFTSSSTVKGFAKVTEGHVDLRKPPFEVACIGPITAETAREMGLPVHVVAAKYNVPGLIEAIRDHFS
jgi:uroporphyrinogen III methyltransferase/synthase